MIIKYAKAHKLSRRMTFRGLDISIETDKGEKRHWFDPHTQRSGNTTMKLPYGYIRRTKGVDGDHVDVYVGPNERAKNVYIIHQMKAPEFKTYDEDKCMLGLLSADAAKKTYLAHYNNPKFFGSLTTMSFEEFKEKVLHSFELERPHKIAKYLNEEADTFLSDDIENASTKGLLAGLGTWGLTEAGTALENKLYGGQQKVRAMRTPLKQILERTQGVAPIAEKKPTLLTNFYNPMDHSLRMMERTSPGLLAHEIGHAKSPAIPGALTGRLAGLLSMFYTVPKLYETDPDSAEATALTYTPTALMAPRLIEEGRASLRGYRMLKDLGLGRKALLSLLPAFGMYLASAGLPIGLAQAVRHHRREREQHPITKDLYPRLKKQLGIE